jgi:hypothetical protein
MNAARVRSILELIPERSMRERSGVVVAGEVSCRHPERLAFIAAHAAHWLGPLNRLTRDEQRMLGLLSTNGRPVAIAAGLDEEAGCDEELLGDEALLDDAPAVGTELAADEEAAEDEDELDEAEMALEDEEALAGAAGDAGDGSDELGGLDGFRDVHEEARA